MAQIAVLPEVKELIERELSIGQYSSESELVKEAVDMLVERRETIEGIERGLLDKKLGRVVTLDEFRARFRARFGISAAANGDDEE